MRSIRILERYRVIFIFFAVSIIIFIIGYIRNLSIEDYYYDAGAYYNLSQTFIKDGTFEFSNLGLSIRGYFFPFMIFVYTLIGNFFNLKDSISIIIGNSIFTSFLFIIILPNFFTKDIKKVKFMRIIIPVLLFLLYWQDLIYYPLSDLYAYGLILMALFLLKQSKNSNTPIYIIQGILIGIFLYAAYNTRTIYLFTIPIIILIYIFYNMKKNVKKTLLILGALCLGVIICSLPQSQINKKYYDIKSPMVITNAYDGNSLFSYQLLNGLLIQRYETYIGDVSDYPKPGVKYIDGVGNQLIDKENLDINLSILQYVKLAVRYPLDYMGMMTRHLINIFHLPYNYVYIKDLNYHKTFFTILNYTILYITGIGLYTYYRKKKSTIKFDENFVYILATIIPCLTILLGAIEMRFFIPIYCLIYYVIAYVIPFNDMITYIQHNKIKVVISYIFILAILTSVWGSTFNATQALPQLLK